MTIQEIAEKTGLSTHTLRYYEKEGIVFGIKRNKAGHREYFDWDLNWVSFVQCLKNTGMSIKRIKEYAREVESGCMKPEKLLTILEEHRLNVQQKMSEYASYLERIDWKIDLYKKGEGCDIDHPRSEPMED